jgi:hypothetical protein
VGGRDAIGGYGIYIQTVRGIASQLEQIQIEHEFEKYVGGGGGEGGGLPPAYEAETRIGRFEIEVEDG